MPDSYQVCGCNNVDDTFILWPHGNCDLQIFHQHLNKHNPSIEFTIEGEQEGVSLNGAFCLGVVIQ